MGNPEALSEFDRGLLTDFASEMRIQLEEAGLIDATLAETVQDYLACTDKLNDLITLWQKYPGLSGLLIFLNFPLDLIVEHRP